MTLGKMFLAVTLNLYATYPSWEWVSVGSFWNLWEANKPNYTEAKVTLAKEENWKFEQNIMMII